MPFFDITEAVRDRCRIAIRCGPTTARGREPQNFQLIYVLCGNCDITRLVQTGAASYLEGNLKWRA